MEEVGKGQSQEAAVCSGQKGWGKQILQEGMHELCGLGEELCGEEALSFECPDWVLRRSGLGVQVETES